MSNLSRSIQYQFGPFVLFPAERQLFQHQEALPLGPRAFDVLLVLLERSGGLVEKRELLERVWPGLIVEDNTLQAVISTLRKVLGAQSISTVSKFGYRLNLASTKSVVEPKASANPLANHLPVLQSSFIGRQNELIALAKLLGRSRNITIHGPGGAGKTRLALEITRSLAEHYALGVWFLDLTSLHDAGMLAYRAAARFGLREGSNPSPMPALIAHLGHQSVLLVIDNAEHMIQAVAGMIDELLSNCRGLVILTTSRQPTGSIGELLYTIPALSLPSFDQQTGALPEPLSSDAMRLFVERARLQRPHFELNDTNAASVARICQRLEGIPLAIELAASRVRSIAVEEIVQRLDDALRLLVSQASEGPRRHQTLHALVQWSYDLLNDEEKQAFRRLAVFSGGFTLDMAESLFSSGGVSSWSMLGTLEALVDKSMLSSEVVGTSLRYRQLETIRQFAEAMLGECGESLQWKSLHLRYFAQQVESANLRFISDPEKLRQTDAEQDNIHAALASALAIDGLAAIGLKLGIQLNRYWFHRGSFFSGRHWVKRLLAAHPEDQDLRLRVQAFNSIGSFTGHLDGPELAIKDHAEALVLARQIGYGLGAQLALGNLSTAFGLLGEHDRAIRARRDAMRLLAGAIKFDMSTTLSSLDRHAGLSFVESLRPDEITALSEDIRQELDVIDANRLLSKGFMSLSIVLYGHGDMAEAERVALDTVTVTQALGEPTDLAISQAILGEIVARLGRTEQSMQLHVAALKVFASTGEKMLMLTSLQSVARGTCLLGHPARSARIWGAAARLSEECSLVPSEAQRLELEECESATRSALGSQAKYQPLFESGYDAALNDILYEVMQ